MKIYILGENLYSDHVHVPAHSKVKQAAFIAGCLMSFDINKQKATGKDGR